jgi:hypothetical protein
MGINRCRISGPIPTLRIQACQDLITPIFLNCDSFQFEPSFSVGNFEALLFYLQGALAINGRIRDCLPDSPQCRQEGFKGADFSYVMRTPTTTGGFFPAWVGRQGTRRRNPAPAGRRTRKPVHAGAHFASARNSFPLMRKYHTGRNSRLRSG